MKFKTKSKIENAFLAFGVIMLVIAIMVVGYGLMGALLAWIATELGWTLTWLQGTLLAFGLSIVGNLLNGSRGVK